MNTKNLWIVIGILAVVAIGVYVSSRPKSITSIPSPDAVACTADAQMCPDGSFVGRTGPNCQFAACPAVASPQSGDQTLLPTGINKPVTGFGVTITPIKVLEDSRCPVDVTCIQAGTVKMTAKVRIDQQGTESVETFSLGVPVSVGGGTITLVRVNPTKSAGGEIPSSNYQFSFKVVGIEFLAEKG